MLQLWEVGLFVRLTNRDSWSWKSNSKSGTLCRCGRIFTSAPTPRRCRIIWTVFHRLFRDWKTRYTKFHIPFLIYAEILKESNNQGISGMEFLEKGCQGTTRALPARRKRHTGSKATVRESLALAIRRHGKKSASADDLFSDGSLQ
jgi:hypothetical protein